MSCCAVFSTATIQWGRRGGGLTQGGKLYSPLYLFRIILCLHPNHVLLCLFVIKDKWLVSNLFLTLLASHNLYIQFTAHTLHFKHSLYKSLFCMSVSQSVCKFFQASDWLRRLFLAVVLARDKKKYGILVSWLSANIKFGSQFWLGRRH